MSILTLQYFNNYFLEIVEFVFPFLLKRYLIEICLISRLQGLFFGSVLNIFIYSIVIADCL